MPYVQQLQRDLLIGHCELRSIHHLTCNMSIKVTYEAADDTLTHVGLKALSIASLGRQVRTEKVDGP